ncbi:hypothetical protein BOTBODRAFT_584685 [Botryobasidium botryosum FD-172 SS1]|uniref:CBF1-interacting co-repressor CIR N-terminal domain-containing protein n=1 Tax=Botryobasidium botryosum (strain FD-172 SS1) TaxID=930990 RepID=A0A067LXK6_BOTB1|nr:hypothetical protein BOTBODRAFT_584685 [Botryobasidium botryosum FD-172 SS1]
MGKLNIAHHKSYHPYRADNIERVRRDEEEQRQKEAKEEGRMMLADSEARIDLLRQRIGAGPSKRSRRSPSPSSAIAIPPAPAASSVSLTDTSGHINFFALPPAEHNAAVARLLAKAKDVPKDAGDKGTPLAPSASDMNPWYADSELRSGREREKTERMGGEERRLQSAQTFLRSSPIYQLPPSPPRPHPPPTILHTRTPIPAPTSSPQRLQK